MKIAFITTQTIINKQDGGLANYINRLSIYLYKKNHEVFIFMISDENKVVEINNIVFIFIKYNITVKITRKIFKIIFFLFQNSISLIFNSYVINKALLKEHKIRSFDIVQYTNLDACCLFRKKIPSIVRVSSNSALNYFNGRYNNIKYIDFLQKHFLEILSCKRAELIFAPSLVTAKSISNITKKNVQVIPTPIFFEFNENKMDYSIYENILNGKKYFLYFGRIEHLKGLNVIAEIIYDFLDINRDIYFVMVGNELPNLKNLSLVKKIKDKSNCYKERVIHIKKISHYKLYPIIKNSEFVVLPSLMDNFPNTCLEAMALGKIVIGTFGASFEEIITDGKNGFLCKKNNPADLFKVMNKAYNFKDKSIIEKNALLRIKDFSPEITVNKLLDVYTKLIQEYKNK